MKRICLLVYLFFSLGQNTHARQLVYLEISATNSLERSVVAKYMHIDSIVEGSHCLAMSTPAELKELQANSQLPIKILSSFNTDDSNSLTFKSMVSSTTTGASGEQNVISFKEKFLLPKKGNGLRLNVLDLAKKKFDYLVVPTELVLESFEVDTKEFFYDQKSGEFYFRSGGASYEAGKTVTFQFKSSRPGEICEFKLVIQFI